MIIKVTYHPQEVHPPTKGWSPTNQRMVTPIRNCIADLGGSPTNPRMVTHQPYNGHLVWPCLVPFDTIWSGFPMFGPISPHMAPFSPVLAAFGPVLAVFGPIWSCLAPFGLLTPSVHV